VAGGAETVGCCSYAATVRNCDPFSWIASIKESPGLLWPGGGMMLSEQKLCIGRECQGELFPMGESCQASF